MTEEHIATARDMLAGDTVRRMNQKCRLRLVKELLEARFGGVFHSPSLDFGVTSELYWLDNKVQSAVARHDKEAAEKLPITIAKYVLGGMAAVVLVSLVVKSVAKET